MLKLLNKVDCKIDYRYSRIIKYFKGPVARKMIYDLQKGSLLKRASAFLLDAILLVILAVGFAFLLSAIFNYDKYDEMYSSGIDRYAEQYGVDFDSVITQADYEALSEAERANYDAAVEAMNNDMDILKALNMLVRLIVMFASVSIFLSYMVIEFLVPLLFKNGQTVGKKIFGLAVMKSNGVRLRAVPLFIRTFLGKYVIETMIPVLIIIITLFNAIGIMAGPGVFGLLIILILAVVQVLLLFTTKTNSMIHDFVADCVVVDMASQMIFDDEQTMLDYKTKKAAEKAAESTY